MKKLLLMFLLVSSSLCAGSIKDKKVLGEVGFKDLRMTDIIIGIEPHERITTQDLIVDLRAKVDLAKIAQTDRLEATVDYVQLAALAKRVAKEGEYLFIDVLALEILKEVLNTDSCIEEAFIRIQKPAALPKAKSGGLVELSLNRKDLIPSFGNEKKKVMAQIGFNALQVQTIIGDLPIERENLQELSVDLRATVDLQKISETDELDSTVNYIEMADLFYEIADEGRYQMIETLALRYAQQLFSRFSLVEEAYVRINKPGSLPDYPFKNEALVELKVTK